MPEKFRDNGQLGEDFFKYHQVPLGANLILTVVSLNSSQHAGMSDSFVNSREVVGRFRLEPGQYCVVPSTFTAGQQGQFLLRVWVDTPVLAAGQEEGEEIKERNTKETVITGEEVDIRIHKHDHDHDHDHGHDGEGKSAKEMKGSNNNERKKQKNKNKKKEKDKEAGKEIVIPIQRLPKQDKKKKKEKKIRHESTSDSSSTSDSGSSSDDEKGSHMNIS